MKNKKCCADHFLLEENREEETKDTSEVQSFSQLVSMITGLDMTDRALTQIQIRKTGSSQACNSSSKKPNRFMY